MSDGTKIEWTEATWNPIAPEQPMTRIGKKRAGRLLDGATHDAMPQAGRG